MWPPDRSGLTPAAHLRAEIARLGLDQVSIAEATGVSRQTINNIVNGRQAISRAMAARLGRLTGRSSDYWLRERFSAPGTTIINRPNGGRWPTDDDFRPLTVLVNHQIIRAAQTGIIGLDPFELRNVQRASLDLTLGNLITTLTGSAIEIGPGECLGLNGGQAISVRTRECVEFPLDYVGRVGASTHLVEAGIMMSHVLQVAPGFKGHLQACLFNAGGATYTLRSGNPIMSLEIMPLGSTPTY
jgi:addiction module HigA family antidote